MKFYWDSLFFRLLVVQLAVVGVMFLVFFLTVGQSRSAAAARVIAPVWADAVHRALGRARPTKGLSAILSIASTEPVNASLVRAAYYPVLRDELAEYGINLQSARTSRVSGLMNTWLEIKTTDNKTVWVSIEGNIFGVNQPNRLSLVVLVAVFTMLVVSIGLTWMLVNPLRKLQSAMQAYRQYGHIPISVESHAVSGSRETRELARTFIDLTQRRAQLDEERELMLTSISHDLRSPLARIRLHAELMPNIAELSESKEAIVRNVAIADRHLSAFLEFSMPATADKITRIDVQALCTELGVQTELTEAALRVEIAADVETVDGSKRLLTRILAAGMENAAKHGATPITISAFRTRKELVFEIEDSGVGIPATERSRLMLPFERGEKSRTTPGTGLGLALADQMARRMGATLSLDQRSRGLVFRLVLPEAGASAATV